MPLVGAAVVSVAAADVAGGADVVSAGAVDVGGGAAVVSAGAAEVDGAVLREDEVDAGVLGTG